MVEFVFLLSGFRVLEIALIHYYLIIWNFEFEVCLRGVVMAHCFWTVSLLELQIQILTCQ
jgi:hypothetical protein